MEAPIYNFAKFSQKLRGIERFFTEVGGTCLEFYSVDLSLF